MKKLIDILPKSFINTQNIVCEFTRPVKTDRPCEI